MIRTLILFLLTSCYIACAQSSSIDFFPMEEGARWTYSGEVEWTYNTNQTARGRKTVESIIEDSFQVNGVKVALLRGGPWDLVWWQPNKKPSTRVIVRRGDRFYSFDSGDGSLLAALRRGEWPDQTIEEEIWFEIPMRKGDEFCGPEDQGRVAKHDYWYCWFVAEEGKFRMPSLGILKPLPSFELRFQTMPSHEIDTVVPGIGITHFIYSHHGTVSNVDVNLVAFHHGTKRRASVAKGLSR